MTHKRQDPPPSHDEISARQGKILNLLIKEYLDRAEPISSDRLKKKSGLNVSPATIRNDLQDLTEQGYINQPHTSAGRIPTEKGYKYFVQITFSESTTRFPDFIIKEIEETKAQIDRELAMARELTKELEEISNMLSLAHHIEEDHLFEVLRIVGPSRMSHQRNMDIIRRLLEEFESL